MTTANPNDPAPPVTKTFPLDGDGDRELTLEVTSMAGETQVSMITDLPGPVTLHWGVMSRRNAGWKLPDESQRPEGTEIFRDAAARSGFTETVGLRGLIWSIPESATPPWLGFVLLQGDRWIKSRGRNMEVELRPDGGAAMDELSSRIVEAEMGPHGWTLMHRFQLCHELIGQAGGSGTAWATLFVWLRFSAIRQLDWQRNYNTKPRELSHAQDRLTACLAEAYREHPAQRDLIRGMLGSLGRGGDGQRIRDEILHIMHRHHIKEVGGTWMEQWHQKLHNNTTPDDIVICEAYLAFLHANGDPRAYHGTLHAGGVTEERLASLERPITTEPEFHGHLKEGLLHDFGHYLVLLKSVHSGTDLTTAVKAGGHLVTGRERGSLDWVAQRFADPATPSVSLIAAITEIRAQIAGRLSREGDTGAVKELIYLDLALEQALRTVIERETGDGPDLTELSDRLGRVLENLLFTEPGDELALCLSAWRSIPAEDHALRAKAVLDRTRREITERIDAAYRLLQPLAESLGTAFGADPWVVKLFAEEVVRGRDVFLASLLIHRLDPLLRQAARLGDWQVVSPAGATGEVITVDSLREIQGTRYERPTVLAAAKVHGDEEPPEGVVAVLTPASVDLVSHVAVRARNQGLLFATCYDGTVFSQITALAGKTARFGIDARGSVTFEETEAAGPSAAVTTTGEIPQVSDITPSLDVLAMTDFAGGRVGGKSAHLASLAGKLPAWIRTPGSVALPFGVFEAVLADPANAAVAEAFHERQAAAEASEKPETLLAEIRSMLATLTPPDALLETLARRMDGAGLALPGDRAPLARRISQVWASKWNDRAWFSRRARGFPHEAVRMAVLVQEVIEADYAFVIHTVNPFTRDPDELYAEVVPGLGETLVGNHPGRALGFTCRRGGTPVVLAYPSKSTGLFGRGLIFRSDSNAEDLQGYAGAGLYDSVLLEDPEERKLDFTTDPLLTDAAFRGRLLEKIARLGEAVGDAFGSPQDIEGAVSGGEFAVVQTRPQVGL